MAQRQPGILADVPRVSRYLSFQLRPGADVRPALGRVEARPMDAGAVVGLGPALVASLDRGIEARREFPSLVEPGISVPSTPAAFWVWLRGDDPGALVHAGRSWVKEVEGALALDTVMDGFFFDVGRDLTGYEDGTENPTGEKAVEARRLRPLAGRLRGPAAPDGRSRRRDHRRALPLQSPPDRQLLLVPAA
jgi:putative iron-dependent peroxidase